MTEEDVPTSASDLPTHTYPHRQDYTNTYNINQGHTYNTQMHTTPIRNTQTPHKRIQHGGGGSKSTKFDFFISLLGLSFSPEGRGGEEKEERKESKEGKGRKEKGSDRRQLSSQASYYDSNTS